MATQQDLQDIGKFLIASGMAGGDDWLAQQGRFTPEMVERFLTSKGQSAPFVKYEYNKDGSVRGSTIDQAAWEQYQNHIGDLIPLMYPTGDRTILSSPQGYTLSDGTPISGQDTRNLVEKTATTGGAGNTGANGSGSPSYTPTGVPELDAILGRMDQYLKDLQAQGKTINPNIELTPQEIQKFLDQASSEIEPYYAQQINLIKGDLTRSLTNLQKQYDLQKQNAEAQFKQNIEATRENAADTGTVFSGRRMLNEQNLQNTTQRSLDSSALSLQEQAGDLARNAERTVGSRNLNGVLYPTLSAPVVNPDGFSSRNLDYFAPSDITGSLERERMTAIQSRKNELEAAARGDRALNLYSV